MLKEQKDLTRAEMDVMRVVWEKGTATVHAILDEMIDPKPAYSTVATVLRVLEKKGFVARHADGRVHEFRPEVAREAYAAQVMDGVLGNFFGGSVVRMMSFFAEKENISTKEFDEIVGILRGVKGAERNEERPKRMMLWTK